MSLLTDEEIDAGLAELPGWEREGDELVRVYRLDDFRQAVTLVVALAFEAEAANHHPDVDVRYNRVRLALSTHSEGGITAKDLSLAAAIEGRAGALGPQADR